MYRRALGIGVAIVIVYWAVLLYRIDQNTRDPLTSRVLREIVQHEVPRAIMEAGNMLEAEWVDVNGMVRRVRTTKREPGHEKENEEQFQDRHEARVQAQLKRYPKA